MSTFPDQSAPSHGAVLPEVNITRSFSSSSDPFDDQNAVADIQHSDSSSRKTTFGETPDPNSSVLEVNLDEKATDTDQDHPLPELENVPSAYMPSRVTVLLGRYGLLLSIITLNTALLVVLLFAAPVNVSLGVIAVFKARDVTSVIWQSLYWAYCQVRLLHSKPEPESNLRKLNLLVTVPVYKESTEQILMTIDSILDDNHIAGSKGSTVVCILADGFGVDTDAIFTSRLGELQDVSYTTWKGVEASFTMAFGYRHGNPVVALLKSANAGKKDSLILPFDIFNSSLHGNIPEANLLARQVVMDTVREQYGWHTDAVFDYIFATDADTIILPNSVQSLVKRLENESVHTVAACGLVEVEWSRKSNEWRNCGLARFWDHFQGFQYLYGQWVRRGSESTWGRVTCLLGAITLLRTGDYLGRASVLYRKPVTSRNMVLHQVQYLGTDRRLTWSLLSLSKSVRTVLERDAACYTMPPQSLKHYLSQRRRWGSNAFFNALVLLFTPRQFLVTRGWMFLEVLRTGLIFFRLGNFAHFIYTLTKHFEFIAIVPLLVVTLLPQLWFLFCVVPFNRRYRNNFHHLAYGELINRTIGLIISPLAFIYVMLSFGDFRWGATHGSASAAPVSSTDEKSHADATISKLSLSHSPSCEGQMAGGNAVAEAINTDVDLEKQLPQQNIHSS